MQRDSLNHVQRDDEPVREALMSADMAAYPRPSNCAEMSKGMHGYKAAGTTVVWNPNVMMPT